MPPASRLRLSGLLLAGLAVYGGLAVSSLRTTSAVYDEAAHLPAGYTYLKLGDFRMNPEHPPLAKELAALPLLLMDVHMRLEAGAWRLCREWDFGHRFLYEWNDADRVLFWGRLPIVALGGALAAAVLLWSRRRFGPAAGAVAFFLCVLSPDVLAHGQLVTTDLAVTLFLFLTVVAFEAVTERVTAARVTLAGLSAGAALASKFTAVLLVPMLLALALAAVLRPVPPGATEDPPAAPPRLRSRAGGLALALAAMAAIALAVVWASYGFEARLSPDADAAAHFEWARLEHPDAASAVLRATRAAGLLPDPYVFGMMTVLRDSEARPAFLFGRVSYDGFWYYFPATFLLKTPLALIGLLALPALVRREPGRPRLEPFVWVPVAVYVAATLTRHLNIGHRHLLPIYPFLFAAAGSAAARAWAAGGARRAATIALCAWYALSVLRVHPHYLSYFNELAGGPSGGWRMLVDSNVDWGQDLKGLKRWTEANGIDRLKLSYFGTADPAYYGIPCEMLPSKMRPAPPRTVRRVRAGEIVAVSATNLQGVYLEGEDRRLVERFRALTPIGRVGYSIFVYRADFSDPAP